jgi:dipeptidyl aminopeptidase/acylaminoacyl peptidase
MTALYSPDGRYIAYLATLRPNAASDMTRLFVYERTTGTTTNLTELLDRSIASHSWGPDSRSLYLTFEDQGLVPLARMDLADNRLTRLSTNGVSGNIQLSADGSFVVFTNMTLSRPNEVFRVDTKTPAAPSQLTFENQELLKQIRFGEYSSFTFPGARGDRVQCWQIKPPDFDPGKRYPLLLLMHGGPEYDSWDDHFRYRWNAQLFAAAGYVVIAPNFHGSTGFGLRFMDAIKGDWAGRHTRTR